MIVMNNEAIKIDVLSASRHIMCHQETMTCSDYKLIKLFIAHWAPSYFHIARPQIVGSKLRTARLKRA